MIAFTYRDKDGSTREVNTAKDAVPYAIWLYRNNFREDIEKLDSLENWKPIARYALQSPFSMNHGLKVTEI
ncbi:hypothetical protein PT974_10821 [Cladobotryum mycophilum]|uniref:Uncharacterized protein n=1 Tax=Cladobotryum mycophilum TaxID=491253 RepID=A0ABR0SB41_9HYPO